MVINMGYSQTGLPSFVCQKKTAFKSHIVLNLNKLSVLEIKPLLNYKAVYGVVFSKTKKIDTAFIAMYKAFNDRLIVISKTKFEEYATEGLKFIYKDPKDLECRTLSKSNIFNSVPLRFYNGAKSSYIKVEDGVEVTDTLLRKIWIQSSKRPNYIEPAKTALLKTVRAAMKCNSQEMIFGVITAENGELVNGVKFKGFEQVVVNGYYSFPIKNKGVPNSKGLPILIPYKAGYQFSPNIIYTTWKNAKNCKQFNAYKLDLEYGLSNYFVFYPSFSDQIEGNKRTLLHGVKIKRDSSWGIVGFFSNRSHIITGIKNKELLRDNFTITAWVKPTSLDYNNGIVGMTDFSLKLHQGVLTFTIVGGKDYKSKVSIIPLNIWTHVAVVYSKIDRELFFYVNGKLTEKTPLASDIFLDQNKSHNNLEIGTNVWEEFYEGYMADIGIWERELNASEIKNIYEQRRDYPQESTTKWGMIVLGIVTMLIFIYIRKRKSKGEKITPIKKREGIKINRRKSTPEFPEKEKSVEHVLCFGKLKILDKDGQDIAKKLSPLLEKLFIVIFSYPRQKNKQGITTKQLTDFLWPMMSCQNAKNNRGANINKLRKLLSTCEHIHLVFKNNLWMIELSDSCYCDYDWVQNYIGNFSRHDYSTNELQQILPKFLRTLKKGRLFLNINDPWMDSIIMKFSNQIIEQCLSIEKVLNIEKQDTLLLDLTEVIDIYDDLNEDAHRLKLSILIRQGKLRLAYKTYDNFAMLYHKIYGEAYPVSFEEMNGAMINM